MSKNIKTTTSNLSKDNKISKNDANIEITYIYPLEQQISQQYLRFVAISNPIDSTHYMLEVLPGDLFPLFLITYFNVQSKWYYCGKAKVNKEFVYK